MQVSSVLREVLAAVREHAAQVLGGELDGVSGFFTSCATWRAMSAQAARRLLRSRSRRWRVEVARHLVEGLDQPPQLVLAGGLHARLEVALGDAPGGRA